VKENVEWVLKMASLLRQDLDAILLSACIEEMTTEDAADLMPALIAVIHYGEAAQVAAAGAA